MNFDGNDAIVLNQGHSNYIDEIGEIGVNLGQGGWNVPPGSSTKQQDLRRKYPIMLGQKEQYPVRTGLQDFILHYNYVGYHKKMK